MQDKAEGHECKNRSNERREGRAQEAILQLDNLQRRFHQGARQIDVLDGASAMLFPGEAVALVGPSGSGKSTLLHIAGLLETPDSGRVLINGMDCAQLNDGARTAVRRREMGFIYQFHQLLPEFSALENVVIPQMIHQTPRRQAHSWARELLSSMGLEGRLDHRPAELSGGEQQRTAIARALANRPKLILADEPTGNLDPTTSDRVFETLMMVIREQGVAALVATHNLDLARSMDRVLVMKDGKLVEE